jgi:pimeloyl-ACP methyl ester carboxylesterase
MGVGAQRLFWPDDFVARLVEGGHRVIVFDNRDCGESTWLRHQRAPAPMATMTRAMAGLSISAPYTLWDMADDTVALFDALGLDRVHLAGISMGGMIAQCVAIRNPERVRSLTSMHSSTGSRRHSIGDPRAYAALLAPGPKNRDEAAEHLVQLYQTIGSPAYEQNWDELRERGRRAFDRGSNPAGFLRQWSAILASGSRDQALKAVQVPTLVIHGDADRLVPLRAGRHTARCIPNAHLEVIEGLGHDLPPAVRTRIAERIIAHAARAAALRPASSDR